MDAPDIQEITDAEQKWIDEQIAAGRRFVAEYAPQHSDLDLVALDAAWRVWIATELTDVDEINQAINCIGIPLGSLFIATGEFDWCIASDEWGTDLAVRALPKRGDVLVFPADFVSKQWETRTTDFLVDTFAEIMKHVSKVRQDWDAAASQP